MFGLGFRFLAGRLFSTLSRTSPRMTYLMPSVLMVGAMSPVIYFLRLLQMEDTAA